MQKIRIFEAIDQVVLHETGYRIQYLVNNNSIKFTAHFCIQPDGTIC